MSIVISSGHGKLVRGASGYLDEVEEARMVVEQVADYLRKLDFPVVTFHDDTSTSQSENLETIVDFHNAQDRELDVSVHFNAYQTTSKPMGCEVLYTTQSQLAEELSAAISSSGGFIDRGPKYRSDLYFLNKTEKPAVLLEVCFVDSSSDADLYRERFTDICQAIVDVIAGARSEAKPKPPAPTEDECRVDILGSVEGDVSVLLNGQLLKQSGTGTAVIALQITKVGDVTVTINGQDFHNPVTNIPDNQTNIVATVFGGESDYNVSAYDEDMVLNDTDLYLSLPDRFEGARPLVRVHNRATGLSAVAEIWDVGPWNTDDPYWETGERPQAESGTDEKGRTTNKAGIDLSPALAKALEIDGMGEVDWEFVST
jgi:N-acetylmuramoyl-L-alanine amidase